MGRKKVSEAVALDKIEADSLVSCSACGTVWDSQTSDSCPVCSLKPVENPGDEENSDFFGDIDWE